MSPEPLSDSRKRVILKEAGALIPEKDLLKTYEALRFHGGEGYLHKLTKALVYIIASERGYTVYTEVPVHNGIVDLLIIPDPIYVQVEKAPTWYDEVDFKERYWLGFRMKDFTAELKIISYTDMPMQENKLHTFVMQIQKDIFGG